VHHGQRREHSLLALRFIPMFKKRKQPAPEESHVLPDQSAPSQLAGIHYVTSRSFHRPFPADTEVIYLGMGCFWGAERIFWDLPGVYTTAVGYMGGHTQNPSYQDVCTGGTGHAEAAMVVYEPEIISLDRILKGFWEDHDPTQKDRQGNDVGTQYRSAIFWSTDSQRDEAMRSRDAYAASLRAGGFDGIATEIVPAGEFFYAEEYHQQYLAKNPGGYCNHGFCQLGYTSPVADSE
jgi:peptide-methionine (S)-S-oxide reductase